MLYKYGAMELDVVYKDGTLCLEMDWTLLSKTQMEQINRFPDIASD